MARMPDAQWVGPHHDNGVMSRYDIVCIHTIVGYAPAHAAQFSTKAGGTIFQSRDTHYRSAANLHGNHRVIAIENEDHGPAFGPWSGSDVPPLTAPQIEACAKICAWAHKVHGIPLVACPDSKPGSRGIAYHRQGIDGNFGTYRYGGRVAGGELWSSWFGKVCPGDKRIAQIPQIITRARQLAGLEEDDMPSAKEIAEAVWEHDLSKWYPGDKDAKDTMPAGQQLNQARGYSQSAYTRVGRALGKLREHDADEIDVKALAAELAPHLNAASAKALADEIARRMQT